MWWPWWASEQAANASEALGEGYRRLTRAASDADVRAAREQIEDLAGTTLARLRAAMRRDLGIAGEPEP